MQGLPLPWRVEVSTLRTVDGARPSASDGIDARGECTLLLARARMEAAEQLLDAGAAGAHGLTGAVATGNAAVRADSRVRVARLLRRTATRRGCCAALADVAADDSVYPLAAQYDARAASPRRWRPTPPTAAPAWRRRRRQAGARGGRRRGGADADGPRRGRAAAPAAAGLGDGGGAAAAGGARAGTRPRRAVARDPRATRPAGAARGAPPKAEGRLPVDVGDVDPRDGRGVLHASSPAAAARMRRRRARPRRPRRRPLRRWRCSRRRARQLRSHALDSPPTSPAPPARRCR